MLYLDIEEGQHIDGMHAASGDTVIVRVVQVYTDRSGNPRVRLGIDGDRDHKFLFARQGWRGRPAGVEPHPARIITKSAE